MLQIDDVLRDRGSRYAVSGGPVQGRAGAEAFLAELKRVKKFAKATHNTWACVFSDAGPVKNDDGEAGAGAVILKMLERADIREELLEPLLNGKQIMDLAGIKPGPAVGLIRDNLLQAQIAGDVSTVEEAERFVTTYKAKEQL